MSRQCAICGEYRVMDADWCDECVWEAEIAAEIANQPAAEHVVDVPEEE